LKVGIAASMWRGLADMPFPEYLAYCREAGAEMIELSGWPDSYSKSLTLDDDGIETVRKLTGQAGIEVVALGCSTDLAQPTVELQQAQAELMKRHVDIAKKLGARVVGLKVGAAPEGTSNQEAVGMIVECLKRAADYAHERDTFLAVENGGQISNDVDLFSQIIEKTHDLYVRYLLDFGNFLRFRYSPDEVLKITEQLGSQTVHTHMKDGIGHGKDFKAVPLGEGEIDIPRVLRLLQATGQLNPICVQYEGPDQPGVYRHDVAYVKERVKNWEQPGGLVRGLHHVSISSKSFETAYRFYGEALRLPLRPAQGISYSPVLLFELPTGEEFHCHLHGPSTHMHVAIEVEDFEATLKRIVEAGGTLGKPDKRGDGSDFVFCSDPDGNRLEITHHKSWSHHKVVSRY
jgi:sugar phosphate isomerase/epimerase/predicted enzyme related to lactoylglutathione lyase